MVLKPYGKKLPTDQLVRRIFEPSTTYYWETTPKYQGFSHLLHIQTQISCLAKCQKGFGPTTTPTWVNILFNQFFVRHWKSLWKSTLRRRTKSILGNKKNAFFPSGVSGRVNRCLHAGILSSPSQLSGQWGHSQETSDASCVFVFAWMAACSLDFCHRCSFWVEICFMAFLSWGNHSRGSFCSYEWNGSIHRWQR